MKINEAILTRFVKIFWRLGQINDWFIRFTFIPSFVIIFYIFLFFRIGILLFRISLKIRFVNKKFNACSRRKFEDRVIYVYEVDRNFFNRSKIRDPIFFLNKFNFSITFNILYIPYILYIIVSFLYFLLYVYTLLVRKISQIRYL